MALGMGHEKNGVSDEKRTWRRRQKDRICALESALRQWHEFQCGTGLTWEQCEPCQSMIKGVD